MFRFIFHEVHISLVCAFQSVIMTSSGFFLFSSSCYRAPGWHGQRWELIPFDSLDGPLCTGKANIKRLNASCAACARCVRRCGLARVVGMCVQCAVDFCRYCARCVLPNLGWLIMRLGRVRASVDVYRRLGWLNATWGDLWRLLVVSQIKLCAIMYLQ